MFIVRIMKSATAAIHTVASNDQSYFFYLLSILIKGRNDEAGFDPQV
jgi:hypothetical protein